MSTGITPSEWATQSLPHLSSPPSSFEPLREIKDPIHRDRLARLSIFLLSSLEEEWSDRLQLGGKKLEFRMNEFLQEKEEGEKWGSPLRADQHECATCCCFLGLSPFLFPETEELDWHIVQKFVIGLYQPLGSWNLSSFLFGQNWPDDPMEAAKRALIVLEEGVPKGFFEAMSLAFEFRHLKKEDTISSLLERFKPFLLEEK